MITKGSILFHKKFIYENGSLGEKLLVVLNSPSKGEPFLFVKTTSRQHHNPRTPGCIDIGHKSLFYIPAGKDSFPDDTWVQLYSFEAMDHDYLVSHPDIQKIARLRSRTVNDILTCLFKTWGDNIASWQKRLLDESLLKLKEKFNKNKP